MLSERAFGNAIDIAGFEFAASTDGGNEPYDRAFSVSIEGDWQGSGRLGTKHERFLKTLVQRLDDQRVFRGMLVPPAGGHDDHLHLDMGWLIYVNGDPSM